MSGATRAAGPRSSSSALTLAIKAKGLLNARLSLFAESYFIAARQRVAICPVRVFAMMGE
jgi:hypothetical protein